MVAISSAALSKRRYQNAVIATIVALVCVRLLCAAFVPLAFDEAYYWLFSKHLAGGYLDHPPMTPILIRLGTTLFGNTEFGVRSFGVLLALPASWAVWRAGAILFDDDRVGATAALYLNITLVMAAGSIIMTPDGPLVAATALLLFFLVKLFETGRGEWWLAIGVAFGIDMLSKYTTIFFAVSILVWLLLVPELRKWLFTPWPWLSGVIAFAVFSPTVIWNAQHHWVSFLYQSKRLLVHQLTLRYLGEFLLSQIGMATPSIFVLGCMGLGRLLQGKGGSKGARVLINAMIWPIVIYFIWHSLHGRVQGNWPEPIFVAFVIAAAVAVEQFTWNGSWESLRLWSQRLAVPVGLVMAGFIYLQGAFGIIPLGRIDPTARALAAGWKQLARKLDAERLRLGAPVVLTTNHGLTGWLEFYLPSHPPVEQINERIRYVNAPKPDPVLFRGVMMYVCESVCREISAVRRRFATMERVTSLTRTRNGVPISTYVVYRLSGPIGQPLDRP